MALSYGICFPSCDRNSNLLKFQKCSRGAQNTLAGRRLPTPVVHRTIFPRSNNRTTLQCYTPHTTLCPTYQVCWDCSSGSSPGPERTGNFVKTKFFIKLEQSLECLQKTIDKRHNIARIILCRGRILRGPAVNNLQISQDIFKIIARHDLQMKLASDPLSGLSRHCNGGSNMPKSDGISAATSFDDFPSGLVERLVRTNTHKCEVDNNDQIRSY